MKARIVHVVASIAAFVAIACAPGVDATESEAMSSPLPTSTASSIRPVPTSTPWPRFGPPPVTEESVAATVLAAPIEPTAQTTAVAGTPVAPDPSATDSVGSRVVPMHQLVLPDTSGTFIASLPYGFRVPPDWQQFVGDDEIVIQNESDSVRVTLNERRIDRSRYSSVYQLANVMEPVTFANWTERARSDFEGASDLSARIHYAGTRLGRPHVAVVDWYLWGDLLVEVVIEAEASVWSSDSKLRNTAQLTANSFSIDPDTAAVSKFTISNQLKARFTHKPSSIFSGSTGDPLRTELSCREVYHNLLSEPFYTGSGVWQAFALGDQGVHVWHIYEPQLSILEASHNTGVC